MNRVELIGRLTADPELRFTPSTGKAVTKFTLAIDRQMSREQKEQAKAANRPTTDFIRVIAWGKTAENCANYLAKGRLISVEGSIVTGSYTTQTGEKRYTTEVAASNVQFLERAKDNGPSDNFNYGEDFMPVDIPDEEVPF